MKRRVFVLFLVTVIMMTITPSEAPASETRIDLNSATVEQLIQLPGIGPVIARRIVEYRTEHGPFTSVEEVLNIKGIGPKRFERIKDLITVIPPEDVRDIIQRDASGQ